MPLKIICVAGARPNFMKIAPIIKALNKIGISAPLVHTGQHYDQDMNDSFFRDLEIPSPNYNLEVGSGSHAVQTALVMQRFEPVLDQERPDGVLVVGDVNSTIACALVAVKKGIAPLHVEAGLRSGDRTMPEEINRILTDQISELLFTTEKEAKENLLREGIESKKIHFCGNVMIDSLHHNMKKAVLPETTLGKELNRPYALLTLHRPSNVDIPDVLKSLLETIITISRTISVVFPIHPRTRARIAAFGLDNLLLSPDIITLNPLSYNQMLGMMSKARLFLTDSGGIQEETTALGIPCLTLRENTERPITVTHGTNQIVGTSSLNIIRAFAEIIETGGKTGRIPELWDGRAADRIAEIINLSMA